MELDHCCLLLSINLKKNCCCFYDFTLICFVEWRHLFCFGTYALAQWTKTSELVAKSEEILFLCFCFTDWVSFFYLFIYVLIFTAKMLLSFAAFFIFIIFFFHRNMHYCSSGEKKKKQKNKSSWLIFLKQPKIEQVGLPVMQKQHSWCVSLSFSNGNTVCCLTASALTGWPDTLKQ